ncbi:DUF3604 domain-containing protein [Candidatus Marinimicrobia bacterium MT.SAG.3]|nr:DUF3604 domain-containing protein [Candidatus Marinimicrobia bacterium MT.SAG.3]
MDKTLKINKIHILLSLILLLTVFWLLWSQLPTDRRDKLVWLKLNVVGKDSVNKVLLLPTELPARSSTTLTFEIVPEKIFSVGANIVLNIPWTFLMSTKSWTQPQSGDSSIAGFVTVSSTDPETEISTVIYRDAYNYRIRITFGASPPEIGDTIRVIYGDTTLSDSGSVLSQVNAAIYDFNVFLDREDKSEFLEIHPIPKLKITSRRAKWMLITLPSLSKEGESIIAKFVALDEYNNRDYDFVGRVKFSCSDGCNLSRELSFGKQDSGRVELPLTPTSGIHQLSVNFSGGRVSKSNPFKVIKTEPEYRLYWGDLQNHSDLSDGSGSIEEFYHYARYVANLDIVALTDHDHAHRTHYLRPEIWEKIKSAVINYYDEGEFVTFLGWEWTKDNEGHKHILYPDIEGIPFPYTLYPTAIDLWNALDGKPALTIPHHVAWERRKVDWTRRNDQYQRVVEIFSQHGANEYYNNPLDHTKEKDRAEGHYVRDALAMGHKLGILASSDGHFGYPGNGWMIGPTSLDSTSRATGLVGIYSKKLTRKAIFDAIVSRRVYGSTDHRTILSFKVNGEWMGSEIQSKEPPIISGFVNSHTLIKFIEIIKYDGKIYSSTAVKLGERVNNFEFTVVDSSYIRSSFYYLRVTSEGNVNDRFAWSSPIWVNKPPIAETDSIPDEYNYEFPTDIIPYTKSGTLSYEAFNSGDSSDILIFINGIYLSSISESIGNDWSNAVKVEIPNYLMGDTILVRFEHNENLITDSKYDWGIRNVSLKTEGKY